MTVGDFKLVGGYSNKDWNDLITNNKISYWGKNIYALYINDSGFRINDELISNNHVNFKRDSSGLRIEGILINNTSRDMLTADCVLDRFIKQVVPSINSQPTHPLPYQQNINGHC